MGDAGEGLSGRTASGGSRASRLDSPGRRSSVLQEISGLIGRLGGKRRSILNPETVSRIRLLRETLGARKTTLNDFELYSTVGTGAFGRVRMVRVKEHVIAEVAEAADPAKPVFKG